jgi:Protein of unknown function (DUF2924)
MEPDVSAQIAQLRDFSRQQLLDMWQGLYRRAAPQGIRRELMVPFLAYKIQENAYGGLKASTRSELRRIARDLEKSSASAKPRIRSRIKSGTRIVRQWRGQTHEVLVTETGYEYDGTGYRSLSGVARKITGARWSGPAFFELNTSARSQGRRDD